MSTIDNHNRLVAQAIADELLTNFTGEKSDRLVLRTNKRDMGGLCESALIERITDVLNKWVK